MKTSQTKLPQNNIQRLLQYTQKKLEQNEESKQTEPTGENLTAEQIKVRDKLQKVINGSTIGKKKAGDLFVKITKLLEEAGNDQQQLDEVKGQTEKDLRLLLDENKELYRVYNGLISDLKKSSSDKEIKFGNLLLQHREQVKQELNDSLLPIVTIKTSISDLADKLQATNAVIEQSDVDMHDENEKITLTIQNAIEKLNKEHETLALIDDQLKGISSAITKGVQLAFFNQTDQEDVDMTDSNAKINIMDKLTDIIKETIENTTSIKQSNIDETVDQFIQQANQKLEQMSQHNLQAKLAEAQATAELYTRNLATLDDRSFELIQQQTKLTDLLNETKEQMLRDVRQQEQSTLSAIGQALNTLSARNSKELQELYDQKYEELTSHAIQLLAKNTNTTADKAAEAIVGNTKTELDSLFAQTQAKLAAVKQDDQERYQKIIQSSIGDLKSKLIETYDVGATERVLTQTIESLSKKHEAEQLELLKSAKDIQTQALETQAKVSTDEVTTQITNAIKRLEDKSNQINEAEKQQLKSQVVELVENSLTNLSKQGNELYQQNSDTERKIAVTQAVTELKETIKTSIQNADVSGDVALAVKKATVIVEAAYKPQVIEGVKEGVAQIVQTQASETYAALVQLQSAYTEVAAARLAAKDDKDSVLYQLNNDIIKLFQEMYTRLQQGQNAVNQTEEYKKYLDKVFERYLNDLQSLRQNLSNAKSATALQQISLDKSSEVLNKVDRQFNVFHDYMSRFNAARQDAEDRSKKSAEIVQDSSVKIDSTAKVIQTSVEQIQGAVEASSLAIQSTDIKQQSLLTKLDEMAGQQQRFITKFHEIIMKDSSTVKKTQLAFDRMFKILTKQAIKERKLDRVTSQPVQVDNSDDETSAEDGEVLKKRSKKRFNKRRKLGSATQKGSGAEVQSDEFVDLYQPIELISTQIQFKSELRRQLEFSVNGVLHFDSIQDFLANESLVDEEVISVASTQRKEFQEYTPDQVTTPVIGMRFAGLRENRDLQLVACLPSTLFFLDVPMNGSQRTSCFGQMQLILMGLSSAQIYVGKYKQGEYRFLPVPCLLSTNGESLKEGGVNVQTSDVDYIEGMLNWICGRAVFPPFIQKEAYIQARECFRALSEQSEGHQRKVKFLWSV